MTLLQVLILAIVQGLTEFLPVSSSAHLTQISRWLGWQDQGLTFDVALHAGTLLAVLIYFARDWWEMLREGASSVFGDARRPGPKARLLLILAVATVPVGVAGLLLKEYAEGLFRHSPLLVAGQLILISLVMWAADRSRSLNRKVEQIGFPDGVWIGLAQALAIVPGTSRAGITISAGLFRGLTRESAARFSFLLYSPAVVGASLVMGYEVWRKGLPGGATPLDYLIGFAVSAAVGYAAIAFLLRYLQTHTLKLFVGYRLLFGGIIVGVELIRRFG